MTKVLKPKVKLQKFLASGGKLDAFKKVVKTVSKKK